MTAVVCNRLANGVMMPVINLGTWRLQESDLIAPVIEAALRSGYHGIDCARLYRNEHEIGPILHEGERAWLSPGGVQPTHIPEGFELVEDFEASFQVPHGPCSHKVFVTTKIWPSDFDRDVREWIQEHLQFFKRERADLVLLHWPGPHHALENGTMDTQKDRARNERLRFKVWKELEKLYHEGLIRALGVSNFMNKHLEPLIADVLSRRAAGDKMALIPMCNQVEGNPWVQTMNLVKDLCKEHNIAISCYRPLGGDKVKYARKLDEAIEKEIGRPQALILSRWLLQQGYIVLPKSSNPERIKMNIDLFSFELQPKHMSLLQQLYEIDVNPQQNPLEIE